MPENPSVADAIRHFIRRFVVLTDEQTVVVTLWILHTWAFAAATATPYMAVLSPTWRSGKTRLLEVLECLVREPFRAEGLTEAVLFRAIDQLRPTLLLDEVDAIFGHASERTEPLRAVLNAGNRTGSQIARCVPPNWDVKFFSVFCAKTLAGIDNGRWPDTLLDRSVVVRLQRRAEGEAIEPFRFTQVQIDAEPIRTAADDWVAEQLEVLTAARPVLPEPLSDRACDAWEPLLAIADALEGDWPNFAREAAVSLYHRQQTLEDSVAVTLLRDVREVFREGNQVALGSRVLCGKLRELPEARWSNWGARRGQPGLKPNDLAMLLRPFGITPRTVRLRSTDERGSTLKGYAREDFQESWRRYLPGGDEQVDTGV